MTISFYEQLMINRSKIFHVKTTIILFRDFISLFYPRNCINCKRNLSSQEEHICIHCVLSLPYANFHLYDENPIRSKLYSIFQIENAFVYLLFARRGIAQKLIHKLKYDGMQDLGVMMGSWFGHYISAQIKDAGIDLIVPIPLHKSRLKQRGYNQCDAIANGLSQALNIPYVTNALQRTSANVSQTKKSKASRWLNVESLFQATDQQLVEKKHILLVDDVITTGATIESACEALISNGASKITIACIASRL